MPLESPWREKLALVALLDHFSEGALEVRKGGSQRRPPGVKHDVPTRMEIGTVPAERLPQTPFDAVPIDTSADGARNRKSQSHAALFVGTRQAKGGEQRA